jgi:cytochrome c-type biogenesis protein CcmH
MLLWIIFALLASLAVVAVLYPLTVKSALQAPLGLDDAHDLVVYRDQLDEIDRDLARSLISENDAEYARTEILRRILVADDKNTCIHGDVHPGKRTAVSISIILAVPAIALGGYLQSGAPNLPQQPFASRQIEVVENQDLASLVERIERHLQKNPTDTKGWEMIGPAYMRLRRFGDAVNAFDRSIQLGGETARRLSSLGEARMLMVNGMVDAIARRSFERAVELDSTDLTPLYYLGLAAVQEGDRERARKIWEEILKLSPEGVGWVDEVRRQINDLDGGDEALGQTFSSGTQQIRPTVEDIAAAGQMSLENRRTMINAMVFGLAERLKENPDDLEGWLRLMRAYVVLGRRDDAHAVYKSARDIFVGRAEQFSRLDTLARKLKLGS